MTLFDAGIADMTVALAAAGARLGGIKRIVLGHADADHRGAAPGLGAPVYCHPAEPRGGRVAGVVPALLGPDRSSTPHGRAAAGDGCCPRGTAGPVEIAGTVQEGDEVAGFRVIELPGHAPGLIGLFRESDRLALVSRLLLHARPANRDQGRARACPIRAFNIDTEQARASIRKLAAIVAGGGVGRARRSGPRRRRAPARARRGADVACTAWDAAAASARRREARRADHRLQRRRGQRADAARLADAGGAARVRRRRCAGGR